MLRNTFLHIPHIGPATEQRLWRGGIRAWDDFAAQAAALRWSAARKDHIHRWLGESAARLQQVDSEYFAKLLPAIEHWRAYEEFGDHAAFVDIETNGGTDAGDITIIGLFDGKQTQTFVQNDNLHKFPDAIAEYPLLVTFNGAQFDLPMLRRRFPRARLNQLHIDLRFALRRLGLCGGLKMIEGQLGMMRSEETRGMNGYDAVILWRQFEDRNDRQALRALVQYNREDVEHLLPLVQMAYQQLRRITIEAGC